MIVRTEGLVLRSYQMTTSGKVVVVFSREHGKLRLAARGARRPKSRFGASLEPVTVSNFVYYRQDRRELQTLSEGDIVYAFSELKTDYRRTVCASVVCDLIDHMTADEDPSRPLFQAGVDVLHWLERIPADLIEVPLWYFQLHAADILGYRPQLDSCVTCGRPSSAPSMRFNPRLGGAMCPSCGPGVRVNVETLSFLHRLQAGQRQNVDMGAFAEVDRATARSLLRTYLETHLENRRQIKALDFLERMLADEFAARSAKRDVSGASRVPEHSAGAAQAAEPSSVEYTIGNKSPSGESGA